MCFFEKQPRSYFITSSVTRYFARKQSSFMPHIAFCLDGNVIAILLHSSYHLVILDYTCKLMWASNCSVLQRKEGNVLFNDALNTFYLRLYGVRHMVKDHSDSERGNPLPPHGLLFPISSFYMYHPTGRIAHTTAFVTPVVTLWHGSRVILCLLTPICGSQTFFVSERDVAQW